MWSSGVSLRRSMIRCALVERSEQGLGAGVASDVDDLVGGQHHVDGVDDGTESQHRVVADDPLPAILRVQRDAVTGPDSEAGECVRQPRRQLVESTVRELLVVDHQRHAVAVLPVLHAP